MKAQKTYFGKDLEAMSFANNYHKWILAEFIPYMGNCVGEVGAGTGNFSEFLLDTTIKHLTAFEPSDNMFALLAEKFNGKSRVDIIHDTFKNQSNNYEDVFDSVFYVNVLEHIKEDREELSHAYKSLHHNGYILIFVPALSFLYSELDKKLGHYRRYSKKELIEAVNSVGFSIKKVKYFDMIGIVPWYVAFVLLKGITTESNVSLYDKFMIPIIRKIEHVITPVIGKNLMLIGYKK